MIFTKSPKAGPCASKIGESVEAGDVLALNDDEEIVARHNGRVRRRR